MPAAQTQHIANFTNVNCCKGIGCALSLATNMGRVLSKRPRLGAAKAGNPEKGISENKIGKSGGDFDQNSSHTGPERIAKGSWFRKRVARLRMSTMNRCLFP